MDVIKAAGHITDPIERILRSWGLDPDQTKYAVTGYGEENGVPYLDLDFSVGRKKRDDFSNFKVKSDTALPPL